MNISGIRYKGSITKDKLPETKPLKTDDDILKPYYNTKILTSDQFVEVLDDLMSDTMQVTKLEIENDMLKERCHLLSGGRLCMECTFDCMFRNGGTND